MHWEQANSQGFQTTILYWPHQKSNREIWVKVSLCRETPSSPTRQIYKLTDGWLKFPKAFQERPGSTDLSRLPLKRWEYRHKKTVHNWHFSTTLTVFFPRVFTSVVRRMPGYNTQHRASTRSPLKHVGFTQYTLYRRWGGLQGRSWRVRKISPQTEIDPRTVQPVGRSYADYAIPALT